MGKVKIPDNFNPGAFPDRPDSRDFKYEAIVFGSPNIDWDKGYNVLDELQEKFDVNLKVENQNGSSSCVGQAYAKYAEVLNIVETKGFTDLSAKSIYEQIFLPSGGAYLRDGAKAIVNGGVATEEDIPSYELVIGSQGQILATNPPKESYMISQTITKEIRANMLVYQAKEYRSIGSANADLIAHAILNNWGAVTGALGDNLGWSQGQVVQPPTTTDPWGHAFYLIGFGQDELGKYFLFLNSWGDHWGKNGTGKIYFNGYDIPNNVFGIWTLIDKPNLSNNLTDMKFIKGSGPHIYLVDAFDSKKIMVVDMPTLEALNGSVLAVSDEELNKYPDGGTIVWTDRIIN